MKSYIPNSVINILIRVYFITVRYLLYKPFAKKTFNPVEEQSGVLKKILQINSETEIGGKYGFTDIGSYDEYKNTVPVHTFDQLRNYLIQLINSTCRPNSKGEINAK